LDAFLVSARKFRGFSTVGGVRILLTGVTGYLGARLAPRLAAEGHGLVGLARHPERAQPELAALGLELRRGDVVTGQGLADALADVDVAYFLIHSMEPAADGLFAERERTSAENFARAARAAGVRRIVYLGGLLPAGGARSPHLASRLAVEEILLETVPDSVALRASIVIGARSRSFRFLVRLIERLPLLALPSWYARRTSPIDERDIVEMLARAAWTQDVGGLSLDAGGREIISYGQLIERIRDHMLIDRPRVHLRALSLTPIASRVASVIAGERHELIGPLMESLEDDLLPRDDRAATLLGLRLHSLDAAIERALRELEEIEPVAAR
jgi:uncharacterized protein YbjT (DUF2867 family)